MIVDVLLSETPETGTVTVTVQVADLPPAAAVITVLPPALAVTLPFESTVAIDVAALVQVTVLFVAFSGRTVAVSVSLVFLTSESSVLFSVTEVTSTGLTVTVQVAALPP